jgi:two-component system response regulator FlrC
MNKGKILVVEDDPELREALGDTLELAGFGVFQVESGEAALAFLEKQTVNMVISDINMGGINGHELLVRLQKVYPSLPVLLITAYGDISHAVTAMRNGAVDYLVKPFKPQALVATVSKYVQGQHSVEELDEPVAEEPSSVQLLALAKKVAATDSTVMISGESGTGKEVLASYIHAHSPRAKKPFIAINCAAIPENMLEAILFGHEKGAFTGAYTSSAGKFEQANEGTLLLDEVSEMDMGLQAKLLRVLQEREVERVGGKKVIPLDVRVIATTNRDLHQQVVEQKFREDLYYRLSVFPLEWLPLRDRTADILPLANRLLHMHIVKMAKSPVTLSPDAESKMKAYPWPGNVRELDNVIQRALILQHGEQITAQDLMLTKVAPISTMTESKTTSLTGNPTEDSISGLGDGVKQREYQLIIDALKNEHGRKKQAAEKLGISPRTLRYKLAKMRESGFDLDNAMAAT